MSSTVRASDARKSLLSLIERVNADHNPVEIVFEQGNAVLLSKSDYDSMLETAYLLSSPVNGLRLLRSLEATRQGEYTERELLD
ncbi:hypothetical protein RE9425_03200 [Prescottella equi]|nr:hypothetical protein RE9425_03200 [Prescottella equi]